MLSQEQDETIKQIIKITENIIDDDVDDLQYYQRKPMSNTIQTGPITSQQTTGQMMPDVQAPSSKSCDQKNYNPCYAKSPIFMDNQTFFKNDPNQDKKNATQGDKLRNLLGDQSIRKSIVDLITQHGIQISVPILRLQVSSMTNYELDENDILEVFSRFGKVLNVITKPNGKAFIVFADIISALFAQKSLNGHYIPEVDVKLSVSLCHSVDETDEIRPNYLDELSRNPPQNVLNSWNKENFADINLRSLPNMPPGVQTNIIPVKYTCKYEIQIDNDRDFQVARKIIGAKGCNMKKIIEICQKKIKTPDVIFQPDFLKLRLRGRGSGFKEGPEQKESDDPLHLCVSSKYLDVYNLACRCVEELLATIYAEYKLYCQKTGRRYDPNLKVKRTEAFGKVDQSPMNFSVENQSLDSFNKQFEHLLSLEERTPTNSTSEERKGEQNQSQEGTPTFLFSESFKELLEQRGINIIDTTSRRSGGESCKNGKN